MKLVATSDLHGTLVDFPECDVAVIAGDVCPVEMSHYHADQRAWMLGEFVPYLESIPARDVVWVGGNHDFVCEYPGFGQLVRDEFPPWTHYLCSEGVSVQGLNFYGIPYCPNLSTWAFYATDSQWKEIASRVPLGTDVVISHCPPRDAGCMRLDGGHPEWAAPHLLDALKVVQPELVISGHLHEGGGHVWKHGGTTYANVALLDDLYYQRGGPTTFFVSQR